MDKFIVEHVIISHHKDGTPRLMSLHIPIDGKMRVHTIAPLSPMFNSILNKLGLGQRIILEAHYVQIECPIHYALLPDDECNTIVDDSGTI